ncbi:hypothetical protein BDA99DRAFT_357666 [Phascolomyces articulosus]|uniref:Uncharacterized protein n=1 Tax=Phascolomyces articulosus TaxID=60185 RepID=A0AAD5K3Q8_9FUNG|nr:hypothetical protein BDA99DRAFT_357666 [Phascolomyces articulosus]
MIKRRRKNSRHSPIFVHDIFRLIDLVEVIVSKIPTEQLMMMYDVGYFNNTHEFLVLLAQQRGKLKKGGISDIELVARAVLQDWNGGKIPFYTLPPANKPTHDLGSSIVSSWGQEINIDALQAADQSVLSVLPSMTEFGGSNAAVIMVKSTCLFVTY